MLKLRVYLTGEFDKFTIIIIPNDNINIDLFYLGKNYGYSDLNMIDLEKTYKAILNLQTKSKEAKINKALNSFKNILIKGLKNV